MWTLVFINMMFNAQSQAVEPYIEQWMEYNSMTECFFAREILLKEITNNNRAVHYPDGTQAICIKNKII